MIKRLRINIILINVLFVGIVLAGILAVFCVNNYISLKSNTEHSLTMAAERMNGDKFAPVQREIGKRKPNENPDNNIINAYVVVQLSENGEIKDIFENNATIDTDTINAVVNEIKDTDKKSGELADYRLMYVRAFTPNGIKFVLADTSAIYSALLNNIFLCIGLFVIGLVVIFLISLGLSYLAVKPVKTAWQQQKQFVADASHELKTPLTVILANNNIMMSHKNSTIEQESQWLESTDEEAKHMKKLIDQMLYLAKNDAEQIKPELYEVNISEITEGAVLNFEPVAFENNILIESDIETDITINGNSTMLTQLLHILTDNAVKYAGADGSVFVKLKKSSDGCILSVQNSGDVISKEDLAHLFDRFYRADKARSKGGYGLGLSIAENIVKSLKGKINVESSEQNGTVFTVSFYN